MKRLVLTALCAVLLSSFASPLSAQCGSEIPINTPTNGSTVPKEFVTLRWADFVGSASYDVYFGPVGPGVCTGVPVATVTGTEWTPPPNMVTDNQTYAWRVQANGFNCTSAPPPSTTCASFNTNTSQGCQLAGPTLVSPTQGIINHGVIDFDWEPVSNATSYELFISVDNDPPFSAGVTSQTSKSVALEPGRFIKWAVVAHAPNCISATSSIASFTTSCPHTVPTLLTPARNARLEESSPVTFSWTGIPGATSYDLYVTNDFGQTNTLLAENLTGRSFTTTLARGDWGWYVRTNYDGQCPPGYSEPSSFYIGPSCNNPAPTLASPPNGTTTKLPVTFSWNPVAGATEYQVFIVVDRDVRFIGRTSDTSLVLDHGVAGTINWFVEAKFGNQCPGEASSLRTITIEPGSSCTTEGPALISPANGASNVESPVTFKWHAVTGAVRYAVFVSINGDDLEFYGATQETELQSFVPDGTIRWLVAAIFPACDETRSTISTFTAGGADNCPTGAITLRAPAMDANVSAPVTLSWNPLAGVDFYRVTVIVNGEGSVARRTTKTEETFDLPAGAMRWYVEGLSAACDPVLSAEGRFNVQRAANCGTNPAPTLIAPVGTQANPVNVTSPVAFSWNPVAGALGYRLWISRNGNAFEDVGFSDKTQVSIPLPGGSYSWFLDAIFRGCDPVESTRGFFVIANTEQRCPFVAPTPISPAQGTSAAAPVHFSWTEVAAAEKYRVFLSIDGSEERLIGTVEETSIERVLPPGIARWRVEAIGTECRALSSPLIQFTIPESANCTDDKPGLVAPANGAALTGQEVEFAWTPVSGAVRYVIVAKTEDGSPVPIGDTDDTSFTRRMPFGRNEWWVIAFFAGCEPAESAHFQFTITPAQNCTNRSPILLMPSETSAREVYSPVTFAWSRVPGATQYQIWVAQGSPSMIASTADTTVSVDLPAGTYRWFVIAKFESCEQTESAVAEFEVNEPVPCGTPNQPTAQVVAQAMSGTPYRLRWTPLPNVGLYEVQESTSASFDSATTIVAERPSVRFEHEVTGAPVQYFYRVRGVSNCDDSRGTYSDPVAIFIVPPKTNNASAEVGVEENIVQTVTLPATTTPLPFVAKVDKPWLTVTPSTGTTGPNPITLTVTADPAFLYLGTNTGTVSVEYTTPSNGRVESHGVTVATIPVSISLVTPVTPSGKGTPPPDALIFPVVGHAAGVNDSLFESDIRISNLTPQTMKYQVNFTPSGTDGTQTGSSTTIEVLPNTTIALDDVVSSVFGSGTISSALGMLEVRPLTTSTTSPSIFSSVASAFPALNTAASSRTYNFTPNGTFGQFIPAVPFSKFAGKGSVLSLLQVAQSTAYRANFGFAEAGGAPVDLMVRVFDTKNTLLATIPVSLGATQHLQTGSLLTDNGIKDLADGRVEVEVVNGDGKVTAYVSEIDNRTNDPLLVNAVPKGGTSANRYVVPGMAYINNGFAFWVSDLRIFNAGTTSTPATLTFYPQNNGTPVSKQVTLDAGEIEVLDNVVGAFFGQPNLAGGAIAITTPANTQLSATARTYNQTSSGTFGQFIPGVTVAESVGAGDRALQLLQLETSSRFRTNIGVTETSGNPVRVEIAAIQPDSIVTPIITWDLAPGEFRQIGLAEFFDPGAAVYNARVTVKVISGSGKVTAYGSAIDVVTQDPTYVPAQ